MIINVWFFLVGDELVQKSPCLEATTAVNFNKSTSYIQSPIGKIMVENIDDNLDSAASTINFKENNLSVRPMMLMSNETIMSSNDKNNNCVFFVSIYILML